MKRVQSLAGFSRGDGEQAGAVVADHQGQLHPIEIVSDLFVDIVFARLVRLRNIQRRLPFRR